MTAMIRTAQNTPIAPGSQRGMVLVVALILLLVLTLLGLAATQNSALEEKMAGNLRNHQLAFQAAEAALRAAESGLNQALWTNFTVNSGGLYLYNPNNPPATPLWQTLDWNNPANVLTYAAVANQPLPGPLAQQPEFIIEQMPPVPAPGQNVGAQQYGAGTPTIQVFRITALGTGGSSSSQVMLQTTFHQ